MQEPSFFFTTTIGNAQGLLISFIVPFRISSSNSVRVAWSSGPASRRTRVAIGCPMVSMYSWTSGVFSWWVVRYLVIAVNALFGVMWLLRQMIIRFALARKSKKRIGCRTSETIKFYVKYEGIPSIGNDRLTLPYVLIFELLAEIIHLLV